MKPVIRFEGVSKRYRLGTMPTLREAVASLPGRLYRRHRAADQSNSLWALRGIDLQVYPGETLGIIGPNGAGKSTILKLIASITRPTMGDVSITGRVSSLIELGAGFHPDLTGRENVYLNGTILGLHRRELDRLFDDIVAFAELEPFIDTPVKRYSSGMYARLGFAIAAHVNADILLVDEVLSVGDFPFQQKCLKVMEQLRRSSKTVVFVSHNMIAVQSLCSRVILLDKGQVLVDGAPDQAVQAYESRFAALDAGGLQELVDIPGATLPALITSVTIRGPDNQVEPGLFDVGSPLTVRIAYDARVPVESPLFHFVVVRGDGTACCGANAGFDKFVPDLIEGSGVVEATLANLALPPGQYFVAAYISNLEHTVDYARGASRSFRVAACPFVDMRLGGYLLQGSWQHLC
jgi:homopolymeric O-antigen transport system ATP-binding protein